MKTPSWPIRVKSGQKTLAWLEHRADAPTTILTEHGEVVKFQDYAELSRILFSHNLILFTLHLGAQPWMEDACYDPKADIALTRGSVVTTVRVSEPSKRDPEKRGRRARWIIDAGLAWGYSDDVRAERAGVMDAQLQRFAATEFLQSLRLLFDTAGVGDFPTPASFGNALAVSTYTGPRYYRPNWWAWNAFKDNLVGGRVDTLRLDEEFPELYEIDMNMAYAAAITEVPGGTAAYFRGPIPKTDKTAYCRCKVRAPHPYPLNLGYLERTTEFGTDYPKSGEWEGWYWAEQINTAQSLGYEIQIIDGWGFSRKGDWFKPWADRMDQLRRSLPADAAKLAKLATVAFIGRFAISDHRYVVSREGDNKDFTVDPNGGEFTFYKKRVEVDCGHMLPHINSYVQMRTRTMLFMKAIFEENNLVATNYDAIYTLRVPTEQPTLDLGGWKVKRLTNAIVPNPRWLLSEEKTVTPGVSRPTIYDRSQMKGPVWWKTNEKQQTRSNSPPPRKR